MNTERKFPRFILLLALAMLLVPAAGSAQGEDTQPAANGDAARNSGQGQAGEASHDPADVPNSSRMDAPARIGDSCSSPDQRPDPPPRLCPSYCAEPGLRCVGAATGPGGCCEYTCFADLTCQGYDPEPPQC